MICRDTQNLQYGVDRVFKLKSLSVWPPNGRHAGATPLTNSLTTFDDPFRASLCTFDESLLDDFDFDDVFGWDMMAGLPAGLVLHDAAPL
jgi:hypothetical protein